MDYQSESDDSEDLLGEFLSAGDSISRVSILDLVPKPGFSFVSVIVDRYYCMVCCNGYFNFNMFKM